MVTLQKCIFSLDVSTPTDFSRTKKKLSFQFFPAAASHNLGLQRDSPPLPPKISVVGVLLDGTKFPHSFFLLPSHLSSLPLAAPPAVERSFISDESCSIRQSSSRNFPKLPFLQCSSSLAMDKKEKMGPPTERISISPVMQVACEAPRKLEEMLRAKGRFEACKVSSRDFARKHRAPCHHQYRHGAVISVVQLPQRRPFSNNNSNHHTHTEHPDIRKLSEGQTKVHKSLEKKPHIMQK